MIVSIEHQAPTASVKDAGGRWLQTQPDQHLGSENNCGEKIAAFTSVNR